MAPLVAAALASAASSLIGSGISAFSQAKNNQLLIDEAQKNRDFQAEMSNTSYQRGVADMKAAGLNPGMMYSGAAGASTPSGSQASGMQPLLKGMEVSNALNNYLTMKQSQLVDANIDKTNAETSKTNAETDNILEDTQTKQLLNEWYPRLTSAQIDDIFAGIDLKNADAALARSRKITQNLENEWIPRLRAAQLANVGADTALKQVEKFCKDWEYSFMREYGVRPGDSQVADLTAFVCEQMGISGKDAIAAVKETIFKLFGLKDNNGGLIPELKGDKKLAVLNPVYYTYKQATKALADEFRPGSGGSR